MADANDGVVNGTADLDDFYPVFLDLKQLLTVLPTTSGATYKLKQEENALNFVYTNLTRTTAFSYVSGALTTGFGPSFAQPAASATTQPITASGVDLFAGSSSFLDAVQNHDGGVLLIEGRQLTDKPLVLSVEKDGAVIAEVKLELCAMHLGKLWETSNKANQIFNRTKKDDPNNPNDPTSQEVEGDATYGVPRNNLYVVADPSDNKLKVSLDLGIPATSRSRFLVAAWDGTTKVAGSDAAFPADASQPANLQIAASANAEIKEYRLKLGVDANGNGLLDDSEATLMEIYRRRDNNELRFATVKGISNAKYAAHKATIESGLSGYIFNQNGPWGPLQYARSFLSLFYSNGSLNSILPSVQPNTSPTVTLNAFADGVGYAEWLTHNSGAPFSDTGVATITNYQWIETSQVAGFFAQRAPFALEDTIYAAGQGTTELATATGSMLETFYNQNVKTAAEQALQNSSVGATVTFPQGGGWYACGTAGAHIPNLFRSISPGTWVPPATLIVGSKGEYSGSPLSVLLNTIVVGGDYDAFVAVGRGRVISPQYQITIKKEAANVYKVSEVLFQCAIEDLYDFNYEDGDLPAAASALQLGFGKGTNGTTRNNGAIFRHHIDIRQTYPYPFDHAFIPSP